MQTNARASFILSSQQSFPAPSVSRRRGRPHLYHDNAVPTASSRRNKRSVTAEARRQAAKRSSGGDGEAEVALEAAVASGDEAAMAEAPLALAVAVVTAAEATKQAAEQQQQTPPRVERKSTMYGGLLSPKHGGLIDQVLSADRCSCTGWSA